MFGRKKESETESSPLATAGTGVVELGEASTPKTLPRTPSPAAKPAAAAGNGGYETMRRPAPAVPVPQRGRADYLPTAAESKKLIVGRDIRLRGEVTSCDVLVVEGTVELVLTDARHVQVAQGGLFKGTVEVEEADIAGNFEGDLTVRERLFLRSTGRLNGRLRCANLVVEAGGQIVGEVEASGGKSASRPSGFEQPIGESVEVPLTTAGESFVRSRESERVAAEVD